MHASVVMPQGCHLDHVIIIQWQEIRKEDNGLLNTRRFPRDQENTCEKFIATVNGSMQAVVRTMDPGVRH